MTLSHDDIIRSIEALSPEERESFLARLMERAGISLPAATPRWDTMGAVPVATMGESMANEWELRLLDHGPDKIAVIKVMRELKGLGLKETKDLVESAPVLLFDAIERDRAEAFQKRLVEVGAKVAIR